MDNALTYFGTDPKMLGLATIGGLLSLVFLVWQIARFLYRKRALITGSLYARRRRKLLRDIRIYKVVQKRKASGASDLFIAKEELQNASMGFYFFLIDSVLFAMNVLFYLSDTQKNGFNRDVATVVIIMAALDALKIRKNTLKAWQAIDWAYFPGKGRIELLARANRIRGR